MCTGYFCTKCNTSLANCTCNGNHFGNLKCAFCDEKANSTCEHHDTPLNKTKTLSLDDVSYSAGPETCETCGKVIHVHTDECYEMRSVYELIPVNTGDDETTEGGDDTTTEGGDDTTGGDNGDDTTTEGGDVAIPDDDVPMGDTPDFGVDFNFGFDFGFDDGDDTTTIEDEETPLAAGELLNVDEFFAYLNGYNADEVKPENNITRAEFVTIIFRLLNDDIRLESWGTESRFADVTDLEAWYYNEIVTCDNLGILDYYEDNFEPNKPITRAEVAYIIAMFTGDAYEGEEDVFPDIADSFAVDAINDIATLGIVSGDNLGNFNPDNNITRAEVTKMINILLGRDAEKLVGDKMEWTDNAEGKWYFDFVRVATNSFDPETFEITEEKKDWKALEKKWAEEYAAMIAEGEDEAEDAE